MKNVQFKMSISIPVCFQHWLRSLIFSILLTFYRSILSMREHTFNKVNYFPLLELVNKCTYDYDCFLRNIRFNPFSLFLYLSLSIHSSLLRSLSFSLSLHRYLSLAFSLYLSLHLSLSLSVTFRPISIKISHYFDITFFSSDN